MIFLGVMGDARVANSLSPLMHNTVMSRYGLDGVYMALVVDPKQVPAAVAGFRALGLNGVNVTVPHKQAVIAHLDGLSDQARRLGAVNTISRENGRLWGHNTDADGFLQALAGAGFQPQGKAALVLGAGGAARAVVLALAEAGASEVWVGARRLEQATGLCRQLGGLPVSLQEVPSLMDSVQLLVNATSVSHPRESPEMAAFVEQLPNPPKLELVMDLNYGRRENLWARAAEVWQSPFEDGLSMLAHQARLSFKIWTGRDLEPGEFLNPLKRAT
ncbi:MAG: shikimate dehydrogenase [Desulfarculaceae bacterium]|jgi:shikimate dehydrogenase